MEIFFRVQKYIELRESLFFIAYVDRSFDGEPKKGAKLVKP
jgi:hypothetical protein